MTKIVTPTDQQIDTLLSLLDGITREYDNEDYGLSMHDNQSLNKMRRAVHSWLAALAVAPVEAPSDDEIRKVWNQTQDPIATVRTFLPAGVQGCPNAESMGEHACANRSQCWEPCGELGHSEEHVRAPGSLDEAMRLADEYASTVSAEDDNTNHGSGPSTDGRVDKAREALRSHLAASDGVKTVEASSRRPLTLDRIEELWEALEHKAPVYLARAVEAAHGIGVDLPDGAKHG